jgi:hypothetical protein
MVVFLTLPSRKCLIYGSNTAGSGIALLRAYRETKYEEDYDLKKSLAVLFALSLAGTAFAQRDNVDVRAGSLDKSSDAPVTAERHFPLNPDGSSIQIRMVDEIDNNMPTNGTENSLRKTSEQFRVITPEAVNLTYHGGDCINTAKVVFIFWGPTWASGGSDNATAQTLQAFRNQLGTSSHYSMLTQYYDTTGNINTSNLAGSQADWFDTTNALPSTGNVTDSVVRSEVNRYLSGHGASNNSTIYEVVLPKYVPGTTKLVYSSDSGSDSCGGPNLAYCAYHSNSGSTKYAIEPYPSCSGCQWSGWTVAQNFEHFIVHETREAVTDAQGTAWWDSSGNEADDKCAWTGLFISGGYGYQPEWSNSHNGCVQ